MPDDVLRKICLAYEQKLKELMGEDAFHAYAEDVAKQVFAEEILSMPNGEFKYIALDNFDAITGSDAEFQDLMDNIRQDREDGYDNGADY